MSQQTTYLQGVFILLGIVLLSACSSTQPSNKHDEFSANVDVFDRIDSSCVNQLMHQQGLSNQNQQETRESASFTQSQYIALANTARFCIQDLEFSPKHPDLQTAMQLSALAFSNYLNAGDMRQASETLSDFRKQFPQQDLYFSDFTSFVDTATALVKQSKMGRAELNMLNINQSLRDELNRQQRWALN